MNTKKRLPVCSYGKECYRKNPDHFLNYYHPSGADDKKTVTQKTPQGGQTTKPAFKQTTLTFFKKKDEIKNNNQRTPVMPSSSNKRNGDSKFDKPFKKRRTITPKRNSNHRQVSSDEESDDGAAADVSSHSWTYKKSVKDDKRDISPSEDSEESEKEDVKCDSPADMIKYLFLVEMPSDFFSFYEFCENVNGKNPKKALIDFGLRLVGPFDILSGDMKIDSVPRKKALCHWRFFLDPPEMQTVMVGEEGLHYGYWRDDPSTKEPFVASNTVPDCKFQPAGANLFSVAAIHMEGYLRRCNPFEKVKAGKVLASLKQWAEDREIDLSDTPAMRDRKKKIVATTFHGLGVVVDVEKKTDVGYRPLIETNANIKKCCQSIINAKTNDERETKMEMIERLVNAANIANDECDFGNGLELGIDLFCMGSPLFHDNIKHLLVTAYSLLNRPAFAKIIKAHLKYRRTNMELSVIK